MNLSQKHLDARLAAARLARKPAERAHQTGRSSSPRLGLALFASQRSRALPPAASWAPTGGQAGKEAPACVPEVSAFGN
jgi:hypothetical protein